MENMEAIVHILDVWAFLFFRGWDDAGNEGLNIRQNNIERGGEKMPGTHAVIGVGQKEDPRVKQMETHPGHYHIFAYCPGCKGIDNFAIPIGTTVENTVCPKCSQKLTRAW